MSTTAFNMGGSRDAGIDFGKNIISAYVCNRPIGTYYAQHGSYDKNYFTYGGGIFTCKKNCDVRIFVTAVAVRGNGKLYYNGAIIGSTDSGGGWRIIDMSISAGSTLWFEIFGENASASGVLNVYLK